MTEGGLLKTKYMLGKRPSLKDEMFEKSPGMGSNDAYNILILYARKGRFDGSIYQNQCWPPKTRFSSFYGISGPYLNGTCPETA